MSRDDVPQGQEGERRNGRLEMSEKGGIRKSLPTDTLSRCRTVSQDQDGVLAPVGTRSSLGENAALPVVSILGGKTGEQVKGKPWLLMIAKDLQVFFKIRKRCMRGCV